MSSRAAVVSRGMSRVIFDTSMSLDGFMTAANVRPEEPMGDGGLRLVQWAFDGTDERNREFLESSVGSLGAVIAGRRTYDLSVPWWGPHGPSGAGRRAPVFVITHEPPADPPENGVYTFVTSGIHDALARAQAAAAGKAVCVMGGADLGRQYLRAGLLDEISIHLVPVLLGAGTRMFEAIEAELETAEVVETPAATHLRYRVKR